MQCLRGSIQAATKLQRTLSHSQRYVNLYIDSAYIAGWKKTEKKIILSTSKLFSNDLIVLGFSFWYRWKYLTMNCTIKLRVGTTVQAFHQLFLGFFIRVLKLCVYKNRHSDSVFFLSPLLGSALNSVKCEHCDATFTTKSHLKIHMFKHTGQYPFVCGICGKGFGQRGNLRVHEERHSSKFSVHLFFQQTTG